MIDSPNIFHIDEIAPNGVASEILYFMLWPTKIDESRALNFTLNPTKAFTSTAVFDTSDPKVVKLKGYFRDTLGKSTLPFKFNSAQDGFNLGYTQNAINLVRSWAGVRLADSATLTVNKSLGTLNKNFFSADEYVEGPTGLFKQYANKSVAGVWGVEHKSVVELPQGQGLKVGDRFQEIIVQSNVPPYLRIRSGVNIIGHLESYNITILTTTFAATSFIPIEAEIEFVIKEVDPAFIINAGNRRFKQVIG